MSDIKRPIAGNYNALNSMRETLSGKADSVFSYRNINPYSAVFDELKKENKNLDVNLWQQAANKGELDQYINLLMRNPNQSAKVAKLKAKYGDRVDYDTTMLALSYDAINDDTVEDRFDSDGNLIGKMSQRELVDTVLNNQVRQWDNELLEEAKHSRNFWKASKSYITTLLAEGYAFTFTVGAGMTRVINNMSNTVSSGIVTLSAVIDGEVKTFSDISRVYAQAVAGKDYEDISNFSGKDRLNSMPINTIVTADKIEADLAALALDIRRQYSLSVDAVTGEQKYWGKILHSMADSIGYMSLAMITGNPAAMYLPMFTNNVRDNLQISGVNPNYTRIVTNAATKAYAEYSIERLTGKLFGFSKLDKLMGFSDDVLKIGQQTVTKGVTATGKEAVKAVGKILVRDALKEGVEEVLQESSGMFIDYLYGDQYAQRAKTAATFENLSHAFVVGMATSFAIGSFTNMTVERATGVTADGFTYKMGRFQSVLYNQAVATMAQWQQIANDLKANPNDRITAAMRLQGVVATLGTLYESLGTEKTAQAEQLLIDIQQHHNKKQSIKDQVRQGTYVNGIVNNLQNEVGGKNWKDVFDAINTAASNLQGDMRFIQGQHGTKETPAIYVSFSKAINNLKTQAALQAANVANIDTPIDTTTKDAAEKGSIFEAARLAGFTVVVPTDGRDIIISGDVIFIPKTLDLNDTPTFLKELAIQRTIDNIMNNIPAQLLQAVVTTYTAAIDNASTHYTEAELTRHAILALMFDKSFQLKMLLETHENNDTWGTTQVIDFIKNLKKLVAKTYTTESTSTTSEATTETDGKRRKVLSDISENIMQRVETSLQEAIVLFNKSVKTKATYNQVKGTVELPAAETEILTPEQTKEVVNSQGVKLRAILNKVTSGVIEITPEVDAVVNELVDDLLNGSFYAYSKTVLAIVQNVWQPTVNNPLPSAIILKSVILKTLNKGSRIERLDLVATLTRSLIDRASKHKTYYFPMTTSNQVLFKQVQEVIHEIETTMLEGKTLTEVLTKDFVSINNPELKVAGFSTNAITRYLVLNDLIKQMTGNKFAITQTGIPIMLNYNFDNVLPEIMATKTGIELLAALDQIRSSKPDGVLRLQDLFTINIGEVGKIPLAIVQLPRSAGYYSPVSNTIVLQFSVYHTNSTNLAVILHEMIHASNAITYFDFRDNNIGGSHNRHSLVNTAYLSQTDVKSLVKYLTTNFKISTSIILGSMGISADSITRDSDTLDKFLGEAIYYLSYEEVTARSLAMLDQFANMGFTTKSTATDRLYLVSPDGDHSWRLGEVSKIQLSKDMDKITALLKEVLTYDKSLHQPISVILQSTTFDEMADAVRNWSVTAIETGVDTRSTYLEICEILVSEIQAEYPEADIEALRRRLKIVEIEHPNNYQISLRRLKDTIITMILEKNPDIKIASLRATIKVPNILKSKSIVEDYNSAQFTLFNMARKYLPDLTPSDMFERDPGYNTQDILRALDVEAGIFVSIRDMMQIIVELRSILNDLRSDLADIEQKDPSEKADRQREAIALAIRIFTQDIFLPILHEDAALFVVRNIYDQKEVDTLTPTPVNYSLPIPTSFDFGPYSFTKHTGRSYILTYREGNKFITQEVDKDTLLPVRANQKPLIEDKKLRDNMLFVIAKKTEMAKKAKPEPAPKPEPLQKPKEKPVVFQWGLWEVTEFDKDHYTVKKVIDRTAMDPNIDDDYINPLFTQIQVVSKKTLLPDTMLGATGKPILSTTERANLLDWIEHHTAPQLLKVKDKENPDKERWIYQPNLSKKILTLDIKDAVSTKDATVSSQALLKAKDFDQIIQLIYTTVHKNVDKSVDKNTIDTLFSHINNLEVMYMLAKYTTIAFKVPLIKAIDKYVDDYLTEHFDTHIDISDGKTVIDDIEQTRAYLTNELETNALKLVNYLKSRPELATGLAAGILAYERKQADKKLDPIHMFIPTSDTRSRKRYISNKRAAKSNLKYFVKKGRPIQLHTDVVTFVESTTAEFDKLSKFFQVRIQNGKLTHHDIIEYVATTKSINEYTWQAIAKYIYHNEYLATLGPNLAKYFMDTDRLETLALIVRTLPEGDALLSTKPTIIEIKRLITEFNKRVDTDKAFGEKVMKAKNILERFWTYDAEGKLENYPFIIDEKQLLPLFMRHYDGTIQSFNTIFKLAKTLAGKQTLQSLGNNVSDSIEEDHKTSKVSSGNAATENNKIGVKSAGESIWNWISRQRQNIIDYEQTGYDPALSKDTMLAEDLTEDDKYTIVENYLYDQALAFVKGRKPTEPEEYEAKQEVEEALDNMSEEEFEGLVKYILDKARVISSPTTTETASPILKTIKDQLRNRLRNLITKLAGSKVNYKQLDPSVQALIEFTPPSSKINTEAYTTLSEAELIDLSNKVSIEINKLKLNQQRAREAENFKQTMAKKVEALQKRERALAQKAERIKAREKAIKEGKTLKEKLRVTYTTKVNKQDFTITGPSQINDKLQSILNHTWDKTKTSKVKYMNDTVQTVQNVHIAEEFYKAHAAELRALTLAEIEEVTDWLIQAHINTSDSVAKQTFEATQFFILAYIYNETGANGLFQAMNDNLKTQLGNYLKGVQTSAGTLLSLVKQVKDKLNPSSIMARELFSRFEFELSDADQAALDAALASGDTTRITEIVQRIKQNALATLVSEKVSTLRKIAAIRSMSMVSGPMTWIRNITSNYALSGLNRLSSKIGNAFFPALTAKTENTSTQYKLNSQVTPEIQQYIIDQFIDSGFFDETLDQLSKYNPSQILRHKNADTVDVISDMVIHSIYNHFYSESMFDSKMLNHIHAFLMKRLSDKNFVRAAAIRYLGKILAETNHHIDATGQIKEGIDKDVTKALANAFALATADYMHSDNFFSHVEKWLNQHSPVGWAAYKTIMPFATASWNWFKAAMRYSPVGLGQAIVRLTKLEQEIIKRETGWNKGESQVSPELASYMVRRDLGSGIIGTVALGFGAILAALGYASLEDDDYGTPRLRIGNLRINISSIFGSSSVLAGMALIETMKNKDLVAGLDAMLDPLVDGFFFTDLLQMDANSPKGWFEWSQYQVQSVILSFIPSMVRYISGATYTGQYRTNTFFQKAVVRLPFMGQAFNVPKRTNVYTGDTDGTFWDIVRRMIPYFEVVTKSQSQSQTEMYGLNKEQLNGTYKINGVSFNTSLNETARINKLYGTMNGEDLVNFYANQTTYRVLTEDNKYVNKSYSQMTDKEIQNALDQIFTKNSTTAKISAWLAAGHTYYTNDRELFNTLRKLGYTKVYIGNKGFVE